MFGIPGPLGTLADFLAVALGFGLIVFVHELGHFLAAKWAGIRVLTFSVGFGPALLAWRKGIGLRRGSTEAEYSARVRKAHADGEAASLGGLGVTEYRLSALPLGGYVRMLGQEDLDPGAVSDAPDSYQRCPVWKRLIVISAGVVMNVVTACLLFVVVFSAGLEVEPPKVGQIAAGSPAERATVLNADAAGVAAAGLRPGDRVLRVNGRVAQRFDTLMLASAMARRGEPVSLLVERPGVDRDLRVELTPETSELSGLLEMGFAPAMTVTVVDPPTAQALAELRRLLDAAGLDAVDAGDRIVSANGEPVATYAELAGAFEQSGGAPIELTIESAAGTTTTRTVEPRPEYERAFFRMPNGDDLAAEHLLGLQPLLAVSVRNEDENSQGLRRGDVFLRLGEVEFPSLPAGIAEIRASAGREIAVAVLRGGERVTLDPAPTVRSDGTVGFLPETDPTGLPALLADPLESFRVRRDGERVRTTAADAIPGAGYRVLAADGRRVSTFGELREALAAELDDGTVTLLLRSPLDGSEREVEWRPTEDELARLRGLGWACPIPALLFERELTRLRADGPGEAVAMGLRETRRVMTSVYVTFARLAEGSVRVQHLKGPVGIAHLGTMVASRGPVWLLFFLALISVNLAVINFLPLPIVDGGQFLMLLYEQVRGRPVPIPVQNAVTLAGLVLIGSVFLIVTFNDVRGLLGV